MSAKTVWRVAESAPEEARAQHPDIHPTQFQLMWDRGIRTAEEIDAFCHPNYEQDVHDPFLFTRMREAVDRMFAVLEGDEVLVIHGDYDADGICGTSVIYHALKEVCARTGWKAFEENRVRTYLPDREGDGYGMSDGAVKQFKEEGVNLIVTVDCGIANTEQIAKAYEDGMEVIVVDHHQMPDVLSDKAMLIHPLVPGESYPFKKLAAVGVAYKVATAMYAVARERGIDVPVGYEKWLMDFVSIATITDMVPLIGENRTLESYGLVVLNKTQRPGLLALVESSSLTAGKMTAMDIGFRIGPRINAAGRIAHATAALDVLLEEDLEEAKLKAAGLNEINTKRQTLTASSLKKAMGQSEKWEGKMFIAVVDESIRIGIAGLVAGKLARQMNRPAVVMTKVGEHYVGSGRAPEGFHFVEAMDACRDVMIGGGGHPQACGFTLAPEHVEPWIEKMEEQARKMLGTDERPRELLVDAEIALGDVRWELVDSVSAMEPFGVGNPQPVFASRGLSVLSAERIGKTKTHLRLTVADQNHETRKCIGFGMGEWAEDLPTGAIIDLAYEVGVNEWNGRRELQLRLVDIQKP